MAGSCWWEGADEIVEDPLLIDFLKVIQKRFYGEKIKKFEGEGELEDILDFLLEIGRLKGMPRLYWLIYKIKNPETVASHIFGLALMVWLFGGKGKPKCNMEKLLKMALCHEISAVYTGDTTPYGKISDKREKKKILKKWPRLTKKEKVKRFIKDFKEEKKAFEKISSILKKSPVRKEIVRLWQEYRTKSALEGSFLSRLNVSAVLLQALLYEKENKSFSAVPIWEWAMESADNPVNFLLLEEMERIFY